MNNYIFSSSSCVLVKTDSENWMPKITLWIFLPFRQWNNT